MSKNKDPFIDALGNVKKIKKSNKNYKKVTIPKIKETKKINVIPNEQTSEKKIFKKEDLKIEKVLINKNLKRGKIKIDRKIDFHGLTVEEARLYFFKTIEKCYYSKKRCILFVTGKGSRNLTNQNNPKLFHGKIRASFQQWVYESEASSKILNVVKADAAHGGDGAFFVYLRKTNR